MASFFGAPPTNPTPAPVLGAKAAAKAVSATSVPPCPGSHSSTPLCLQPSITITENTSEVFAVKFNPDGKFLAACCGDGAIRVFNSETGRMAYNLQRGMGFGPSAAPGHSNRVFAVKFHPNDHNVLISGGWDNTIQVWDTRVGKAQRSIFGPHLCGEALDLQGDVILTGSHRADDPLETWDYGTGEKISSVKIFDDGRSELYSAQFAKASLSGYEEKPRLIACGSSGVNEARVYDMENGSCCVGVVGGMSRAVFATDWSPKENKLAVAGGDASIRFVNVVEKGKIETRGVTGGDENVKVN
ncbi:hypothetical protein TL16_g10044 [Triparma laevis f. inornata]|uniref:Uncharacterized protein n=1 Tax=Triparma laevis f. inornata TaxID=1714386 RepID=A0A9W7EL49_9STRA|nr:hypothetical protein TL16_g10044 [Triparma laevis f. inornata]